MPRVISWFSCGAASAYATYLAMQKYPELEIAYCYVKQEHPDNMKFLKEFEVKFNVKIKTLISKKYPTGDINDVFRRRQFIKAPRGAPCTLELKKKVRKDYQLPTDVHIFGYTVEEYDRETDLLHGEPNLNLDSILLSHGITKNDCYHWLKEQGFKIPTMYQLGYDNNNCIGCVKGGMGYWNAIRKDFPDRFEETAKLERELGYSINKEELGEEIMPDGKVKKIFGPVYLDELEPNRGNFKRDQPLACGFTCEWEQRTMDFTTTNGENK